MFKILSTIFKAIPPYQRPAVFGLDLQHQKFGYNKAQRHYVYGAPSALAMRTALQAIFASSEPLKAFIAHPYCSPMALTGMHYTALKDLCISQDDSLVYVSETGFHILDILLTQFKRWYDGDEDDVDISVVIGLWFNTRDSVYTACYPCRPELPYPCMSVNDPFILLCDPRDSFLMAVTHDDYTPCFRAYAVPNQPAVQYFSFTTVFHRSDSNTRAALSWNASLVGAPVHASSANAYHASYDHLKKIVKVEKDGTHVDIPLRPWDDYKYFADYIVTAHAQPTVNPSQIIPIPGIGADKLIEWHQQELGAIIADVTPTDSEFILTYQREAIKPDFAEFVDDMVFWDIKGVKWFKITINGRGHYVHFPKNRRNVFFLLREKIAGLLVSITPPKCDITARIKAFAKQLELPVALVAWTFDLLKEPEMVLVKIAQSVAQDRATAFTEQAGYGMQVVPPQLNL